MTSPRSAVSIVSALRSPPRGNRPSRLKRTSRVKRVESPTFSLLDETLRNRCDGITWRMPESGQPGTDTAKARGPEGTPRRKRRECGSENLESRGRGAFAVCLLAPGFCLLYSGFQLRAFAVSVLSTRVQRGIPRFGIVHAPSYPVCRSRQAIIRR